MRFSEGLLSRKFIISVGSLLFLLFRLKGQCVHPHLFDHSHQTVGAGWREVFFQSNLFYEVKVGIEDFLWCAVAEHADEQRHDAFHDERVALCREVNLAVDIVGLQPHTALATLNQVALCLRSLVEWLLFIAQVDAPLNFVHPVVEAGKLFNNLVLSFVDSHVLYV